jgi:hypothetical protein
MGRRPLRAQREFFDIRRRFLVGVQCRFIGDES